MTDSSSREKFIQEFADLCCADPDSLTELFMDLDIINGITSRCNEDELYFCFVLEDIAHPLLTFAINGSRASAYICPMQLSEFLKTHGVFPFEAEDFLNDFRRYLLNPSPATSYPYGEKFYADISEILENEPDFVGSVQRLIDTIYLR